MQKSIPLYATICCGGGLNTIEYRAEISKTSTTIGRTEYYGKYDFNKYPGIPVIDLTDISSEQLIQHLNISDDVRPKEENPIFYKGTLETFLSRIKEIGIPIRGEFKL